jgi:hypothetical protein
MQMQLQGFLPNIYKLINKSKIYSVFSTGVMTDTDDTRKSDISRVFLISHPVSKKTGILDRVKQFLPQLAEANAKLAEGKCSDIENENDMVSVETVNDYSSGMDSDDETDSNSDEPQDGEKARIVKKV